MLDKIAAQVVQQNDERPVKVDRIDPQTGPQLMLIKFAQYQLKKKKILEAIRLYKEYRS